MPEFDVRVVRTETWAKTKRVTAANAPAARAAVEAELEDSWDTAFPGSDGDYEECVSEVDNVEEVEEVE